ncbi:MAG: hypothetical protein U1F11_12070 [Steroidobacteraceae bacterium]
MQVVGLAGEAIYLTSFKEKMAEFDVPEARHFVDRVFIVILGGPSVAELNDFYSRHFGVPKAQATPAVISVLSRAHGMSPDTRHDLAALPLQGRKRIEADTMPRAMLAAPVRRRRAAAGHRDDRWPSASTGCPTKRGIALPRSWPLAPYHGRRGAVRRHGRRADRTDRGLDAAGGAMSAQM